MAIVLMKDGLDGGASWASDTNVRAAVTMCDHGMLAYRIAPRGPRFVGLQRLRAVHGSAYSAQYDSGGRREKPYLQVPPE